MLSPDNNDELKFSMWNDQLRYTIFHVHCTTFVLMFTLLVLQADKKKWKVLPSTGIYSFYPMGHGGMNQQNLWSHKNEKHVFGQS